jgi:membrane protein
VREIVGRYVKQILDDDVPGLAAELAYRFMFATFPFAIFVVALSGFMASWLGIADPGDRIIGAIGNSLPSDLIGPVKAQLDAVLVHTEPQLLSVGALVTLYAAIGGINTLMKAMNRAYDVPETRPLPLRIALAVLLTVLGGVAVVVSFIAIVGGTLASQRLVDGIGLLGVWPALSLLRWPAAFMLLVAAVAALLRYAPNFRTPWRSAATAATAFAVVWLVVTYAFGLYVAHFATYDATYGALGSVIVLMLWFYLTAFVLLCAAELAALLIRLRSPNSPARPDSEARETKTGPGNGPGPGRAASDAVQPAADGSSMRPMKRTVPVSPSRIR